MAGIYSKFVTLAPNTPLTVVITGDRIVEIEVLNRTGTAEIFYTLNGTNDAPDPTIEGDNMEMVPASITALKKTIPDSVDDDVYVKLICTKTQKVQVRGL